MQNNAVGAAAVAAAVASAMAASTSPIVDASNNNNNNLAGLGVPFDPFLQCSSRWAVPENGTQRQSSGIPSSTGVHIRTQVPFMVPQMRQQQSQRQTQEQQQQVFFSLSF